MLIKVPLLLVENFTFLVFPRLRKFVEKYLYNPLDFKEGHIAYTKKKFQEFKKHLPSNFSLNQTHFLELGPGGSFGMGILAIEGGASKYTGIDDGQHDFISPEKVALYGKLVPESTSYPSSFFSKKGAIWSYNPDKISFAAITQDSTYPLPADSVDVIYSCAVLEHVHNLDLCFQEMTRVLKPGGLMYHEVDLRDHIFHQQKLWFLALPHWLFSFLFSQTGAYINRSRLSMYRALAQKYHLTILNVKIPHQYSGKNLPSYMKKYTPEDATALSFKMILQKDANSH